MIRLLSGKKWAFVSVCLDELLITSRTIEEHMTYVHEVLGRLKETELRLKPAKCAFATAQIEY